MFNSLGSLFSFNSCGEYNDYAMEQFAMKVDAEITKPNWCHVEAKCTGNARNICIRCGQTMCDAHADGRLFEVTHSMVDAGNVRGHLCLLCVHDSDVPVPDDNMQATDSVNNVEFGIISKLTPEDCRELQKWMDERFPAITYQPLVTWNDYEEGTEIESGLDNIADNKKEQE